MYDHHTKKKRLLIAMGCVAQGTEHREGSRCIKKRSWSLWSHHMLTKVVLDSALCPDFGGTFFPYNSQSYPIGGPLWFCLRKALCTTLRTLRKTLCTPYAAPFAPFAPCAQPAHHPAQQIKSWQKFKRVICEAIAHQGMFLEPLLGC